MQGSAERSVAQRRAVMPASPALSHSLTLSSASSASPRLCAQIHGPETHAPRGSVAAEGGSGGRPACNPVRRRRPGLPPAAGCRSCRSGSCASFAEHSYHIAANLAQIYAQVFKNSCGNTFSFADKSEKKVFCAYIIVS